MPTYLGVCDVCVCVCVCVCVNAWQSLLVGQPPLRPLTWAAWSVRALGAPASCRLERPMSDMKARFDVLRHKTAWDLAVFCTLCPNLQSSEWLV
jgi:hypothetical protein